MKKRWWILIAAVILAVLVSVYWDALVMYALPQIPLRKAVNCAIADLDERYRESPVPLILRGYDEGGLQTVQADLYDSGAPRGTLDVSMDLKENQFLLHGAFPEGSRLRGLDLYLDRNVTAVTSESLLGGGWYGITYETFPEDLRSIPLVSLLIPDKLKGEWEDSVAGLQEKMGRSISLPIIPEIRSEDLQKATMVLWAMRPAVSSENGQWKLTYKLEGKTAAFLWEKALGTPMPENTGLKLVFYMREDALVRVELDAAVSTQQASIILTMGETPRDAALAMDLVSKEGKPLSLHISPVGEESIIRLDGKQYAYKRNGDTLALQFPGQEIVTMKLSEAENGFRIQSDDLLRLLKNSPISGFSCDLSIRKGERVVAPDFKNLDQWSLEDLLIFVNGVWTVIRPNTGVPGGAQ